MKLGRYWQGDWPWPEYMGVGLRLTGFPRDLEGFRKFMYEVSCNPIAVERIIVELREKGVKLTTVQPSLNFGYIGDELNRLGVKMEVVQPVDQDKLNDSTIDHAALCLKLGKPVNLGLTDYEVREAMSRASETPVLEAEKLGPYSSI